MSKLCHAAALIIFLGAHATPAHPQQSNPAMPATPGGCNDALNRLAVVIDDYNRAKFALDRAIQLLASARFSSGVGMMNIDLAGRQADADVAIAAYAGAIGPAYGALALLDASCRDDAARLPGSRFARKLDGDVLRFLSSSVDKLADDQMADIKKVFGGMKTRQK